MVKVALQPARANFSQANQLHSARGWAGPIMRANALRGRARPMASRAFGVVGIALAGALALAGSAPGAARAEVKELRMMTSYGISFLPVLLLEHEQLIEKHAKAAGLGDLTVGWIKGGTGNNAADALLSGSTDYAATGNTVMLTLWDKTFGGVGVKGVAAMSHTPFQLNTRNPAIKSLKDFI